MTDLRRPDLNLLESTSLGEKLDIVHKVSILVLSQTVVSLKKELLRQLFKFYFVVNQTMKYIYNVICICHIVFYPRIQAQMVDRCNLQSSKHIEANPLPSLLLSFSHKPTQRNFCLISSIDNDGQKLCRLVLC